MRSLIVMIVALTGCGGPLELEDDGALFVETSEDALRGNLRVRTTANREKLRWRKQFAIDNTNTLFFAAEVAAGPGPHRVVFEVVEPQGNVYQRTEAACDGAAQVFASMPVAGTWIQQFAMTGQWKVKVFLDDAPAAAGHTRFTLR